MGRIAIDSAANYFYEDGKYTFAKDDDEAVSLTGEEMVEFYQAALDGYHEIFLLEDPFAEEDVESWKKLTENAKVHVLGDDLVVTNPRIIKEAIKEKWCNSVLIKPNQIGTITDTLTAIKFAHENNMECMTSHRSGETEDTFIADLCVGASTRYVKAGAPRGERLLKYNRIEEIYHEKLRKNRKKE